jgi:hypothetical protein
MIFDICGLPHYLAKQQERDNEMMRLPFFPKQILGAIGFCTMIFFAASTSAEVLIWEFTADEQQVRNGTEADGSTNSPGTGTGHIEYDTDTNLVSYTITWDNLVGDMTKLHIHGPADAEMNNSRHIMEFLGPPEVPPSLATTSGTLSDSFELQTLIQNGFDPIPPNETIDTMRSGQAYVNYHTTVFGTGEIRGNIGLPVPEPNAAFLMLGGFILVPLLRRRRKSKQ